MSSVTRAILLLTLCLAMSGCGDTVETVTETVTETESVTVEAQPPPAPPPERVDPAATVRSTCDYLLGDFSESARGYRFVADAVIRNTGNIGVIVRATASWQLIGGRPYQARKMVRVPIRRAKRVTFLEVVSQDEIDRHQSADAQCGVRGAIVDTFGEAR